MVTTATREEVLAAARKMISRGVSRRKMDKTLRAKYGRSIGHDTHITLFGSRVVEITEREAARELGFKKPRTRRQSNFNKLVGAHFLPEEARILTAGLNTLRYHEISVMAGQRKALYDGFVRRAAEKGYGSGAFRREWRRTVNKWYRKTVTRWRRDFEDWNKSQGNITDKRRSIKDLIWTWFGHAKKELPPELQSATPRRQRPKRQRQRVRKSMVTKSLKISNLEAQLQQATDPEMKRWFRELIRKEQGR